MCQRVSFRLTVLLFSVGFLFATGCSDSSGNAKNVTKGKVTKAGQPVGGGTITLYDENNKVVLKVGINRDGTYSVSDAKPGTYQVAVETETAKQASAGLPKDVKIPAEAKAKMPVYVAIDKKYNNPSTSGLKIVIKEGGNEGLELKVD